MIGQKFTVVEPKEWLFAGLTLLIGGALLSSYKLLEQ